MPVAEGREPMQPGGPPPAPGATPPPNGNGQRRQASPEEQKVYEEFVGNMLNVAYDEQTANVIVSQMRNAESPVEAVANAAAMVVSTVAASAGQNRVPLSPQMIVRATAELVGDLATNMAEAAGMQPLDERQYKGAYLRTMDLLGQRAAGMQQQNGGGAPEPEQGVGPSGPPQDASPPAGGAPMAPPGRRGRGLMPGR